MFPTTGFLFLSCITSLFCYLGLNEQNKRNVKVVSHFSGSSKEPIKTTVHPRQIKIPTEPEGKNPHLFFFHISTILIILFPILPFLIPEDTKKTRP